MDDAVEAYIAAIDPAFRPLFERIHQAIPRANPDVAISFSYKMPTYRRGARRLHVAAWSHGISIYGVLDGRDGGFVARHPQLKTSRGTLQLALDEASAIGEDELVAFLAAALDEPSDA